MTVAPCLHLNFYDESRDSIENVDFFLEIPIFLEQKNLHTKKWPPFFSCIRPSFHKAITAYILSSGSRFLLLSSTRTL